MTPDRSLEGFSPPVLALHLQLSTYSQTSLSLSELTLESAAVFVLIQYLSHSHFLLSVFALFPSVLIFVFVICLPCSQRLI